MNSADPSGDWSAYSWRSESVLPPDIIAEARRNLDEETYEREYGGRFIVSGNVAYYCFSKDNILLKDMGYNPNLPLDLSFDFNVEPSVCVIGQTYPDGNTFVLDEEVILKSGNTLELIQRLARRYKPVQPLAFRVFGDLTGLNRHTSQTEGNDYDIIGNVLRHQFPAAYIKMPVGKTNPLETNRLITVNSRLKSHAGQRRLFIAPRCKYLLRDLEFVRLLPDGRLDKKSDPSVTHISDALGYWIYSLFGAKVNENRGMSNLIHL
jgi:hypothetical protein